jgi:cytoskeletal protein CcmA (bactofilin family)
METQNSINSTFANNADGFSHSGGVTPRALTVTGADITLTGSGANTYTFPSATDTLAGHLDKLSVFAATTSAELAGVISDETGTGVLMFNNSPTIVDDLTIGTAGTSTGSLLMKGTTSGTVTITTAAEAGTYTLTLPTSDGDASQVLQTDGSGVLSWATVSAGTPTAITVANEATDTSCFPLFVTAATGDLGPKTNAGLSFNSSTAILTATGFSGPLTGNVTGDCSGSSGSCTGTAAVATGFTCTDNENEDLACNIIFVDGATGTQGAETDGDLTYNPSTGVVTATGFAGALTGNVTGDVSGSSGSCTGQAATVANATFTTALTVDTGTVTLSGNVANSSVLTIGAGAVSVSGTNTGDNTVCTSGAATTAETLKTTRAIYGNNFDGSAALTQIIGSAYGGTGNGFTKFTGATTAEKTYTLPNADATLLYSGGALGTPSGGTLTNCTGLPIAGLVASTSTALGVGSIELGDSSDTTLSRSAAGVLAVEGNDVITSATVPVKSTSAEVNTGTDDAKFITPDALAGANIGIRYVEMTVVDYTTDLAVADGKGYFTVPTGLNGMNLVSVHAEVITAGTTGTTDIQIYNVTDSQDMLSTKLTIDTGETGSDTAATPAVINTSYDDISSYDVLRIDVDAISTTAPKGLIVTMGFQLA